MLSNYHLIKMTVEITTAKLSNSSVSATKDGGTYVADFMQEIYNKLAELNNVDAD